MATKSNKQPLNQVSQKISSNKFSAWKEHPIIIAASSFGAALLFSWQFILPVQTARLEAKLEAISDVSKDAIKTSEKLKETERERDELKGKFGALTIKNPLSPNSAYPRGFDKITIGSSFADFIKNYPDAKAPFEKAGYYSVRFEKLPFRTLTVYINKDSKLSSPTVDSLLLFLNMEKIDTETLIQHAKTNFGEPKYQEADNKASLEHMCWELKQNEWVCIGSNHIRSIKGRHCCMQPKSLDRIVANKHPQLPQHS